MRDVPSYLPISRTNGTTPGLFDDQLEVSGFGTVRYGMRFGHSMIAEFILRFGLNFAE
jgi:hypothetical protein